MKTKITSVKKAFSYTGREIATLEAFKALPEKDQKHFEADYSLKVAIEALNKEDNGGKDWQPSFDGNNGQRELWAWIKNNPDWVGFVVVASGTHYTNARTDVGSRHVLRSINVFNNLVANFKELISDVWTK